MNAKVEYTSTTPWKRSWGSLNARAWAILENSAEIAPSLIVNGLMSHGNARLRLRDDAMGFCCGAEPTTFTVFDCLPDEQAKPLVRRAIWQRTPDMWRLRRLVDTVGEEATFRPTVVIRDATVPSDRFHALLNAGSMLQVPVTWLDKWKGTTCDVGAVGFEFFSWDQPPASIRLQWAYDKPNEWLPVADWFAQVRVFLEGCFTADKHMP